MSCQMCKGKDYDWFTICGEQLLICTVCQRRVLNYIKGVAGYDRERARDRARVGRIIAAQAEQRRLAHAAMALYQEAKNPVRPATRRRVPVRPHEKDG